MLYSHLWDCTSWRFTEEADIEIFVKRHFMLGEILHCYIFLDIGVVWRSLDSDRQLCNRKISHLKLLFGVKNLGLIRVQQPFLLVSSVPHFFCHLINFSCQFLGFDTQGLLVPPVDSNSTIPKGTWLLNFSVDVFRFNRSGCVFQLHLSRELLLPLLYHQAGVIKILFDILCFHGFQIKFTLYRFIMR